MVAGLELQEGHNMRHNPHTVTDPVFPMLNTYWNDRDNRARVDAETAHQRAVTNAIIDEGMAALNERQRTQWDTTP